MCKYIIRTIGDSDDSSLWLYDFRYMKFIYFDCGEETKLRDPRS